MSHEVITQCKRESHVFCLEVFFVVELEHQVQVENNKIDVSENDVAW